MTGGVVARKRNIGARTKMKTGCATCRIRRVKCDEDKPFCRKCVDTGRQCDGYKSPFRHFTGQAINNAHPGEISSEVTCSLRFNGHTLPVIAPQDIDLLNRYFSIKTLLDVKLGCDEEARQILEAGLTNLPVRHAVASLRALRGDLEKFGDGSMSVAQHMPSYDYGLQQYCMALGGLASNLSSSGSNGERSALLCCQIFISIEQVRGNYTAVAQHIIRGLGIMRECRARPNLAVPNNLVPANHDQMPLLDVFLIKFFSAPCKFTHAPATADISGRTSSVYPVLPRQQLVESRTIAPNMRTELTSIALSTLEFLGKVSKVDSVANALRLLSDRAALLDSLKSWLTCLELVHQKIRSPSHEPLSVSFMRIFHQILKITLLGTLAFSLDSHDKLQIENDRLQAIANNIGQTVKTYRMPNGTINSGGSTSKAR